MRRCVRAAMAGIVRDQDDGLVVRGQLFEDGDDVGAGLLIEIAGRLVGEDQRRVVDQRAGDGDALALAAGELVRTMLRALVQADALERFEARARGARRVTRRRRAAAARRSSGSIARGSRLNVWKTNPIF